MNSLYKVFNNLNKFYTEINPATLTGAIDVVVVEQEDGSLHCSPFHVRFGKLGVLRSREKVVDIEVNGEPVDIHMKLGDSGEAFFVEEIAEDDAATVPDNLATSPIPTSQFLYEEEDDEERQQLPIRRYGTSAAAINSALIELELEPRPRRNSFDLGENVEQQHLQTGADNTEATVVAAGLVAVTGTTRYENQESGFTHRRYTTDSVKRNEMSNEKLKLTKQKIQQEWVGELQPIVCATPPSVDEDVNDGGGVVVENKEQVEEKEQEQIVPEKESSRTAAAVDMLEDPSPPEDSKSKKKRRKKSIMKKKNTQRKNSSSSSNGSAASEMTLLGKDTDSTSSSQPTPVASLKDSIVATETEGFKPIQPEKVIDHQQQQERMRDLELHFFSDTEVSSATGRKNNSRPSTPILSDTEFEICQRSSQTEGAQSGANAAWKWGELPTPPGESPGDSKSGGQQRGMLTAMFSFMKQSRKGEGGMYLSDLDAEGMDPEVAALYFPEQSAEQRELGGRGIKYPSGGNGRSMIEDDRESGNGTSLPHSPSSVDGLGSSKTMMMDSDLDESRERNLEFIALSTCGGLERGEPTVDEFEKHLVTYTEACRNPSIFASPNLVVRLNNKYYTWAAACPIVMTMITFRKPLPQETVEQLVNVTSESGGMKDASQQPGGRGFSWFNWRRSTDKNTTPDKSFGKDRDAIEGFIEPGQTTEVDATTGALKTVEENVVQHRSDASGEQGSENEAINSVIVEEIKEALHAPKGATSKDKYKKSLRLSSEQIEALNLRNGTNEVQFSVTTAYQGTSRCKCYIFLWKYNDKVVISDVDGTITKSDVLGHLMPLVGRDWAQIGVAELYSKIEENGYKMLYLSARAIGQSRTTREYLRSIRQGDVNLPDGPLLLNPTSLLSAFHREVIEKKPELFKIACLNDIKALFPANPFYAGYGNRINDVWAYRAVGIPIERIFTINTKGELRHELTQTFQSSYCSMAYIADHLFPPIQENDWARYDEYSNFNFWRDPVAEIALDDFVTGTQTPNKSPEPSPNGRKQKQQQQQQINDTVVMATSGRSSTGAGGGASGNNSAQLTTIPEK